MPTCIVLFCGLPGSGKTTLIKFITERVSFSKESADEFYAKYVLYVISYDELVPLQLQEKMVNQSDEWKRSRQQILRASEKYICETIKTNNYNNELLHSTEEAHYEKLKTLNERRNDDGAQNQCFLVEDNFYYSSMRYKWFQLARKYGLGFSQIYSNCTTEEAIERNSNRIEKVPKAVIERISERIEKPDHEKNHWEKHSIIINMDSQGLDELHIKEVFLLMDRALEDPVQPVEDTSLEMQQSCQSLSQNIHHQIDQIMRKLVSKKMAIVKDSPGQDPQKIFQEFNIVKQTVALKFKNERIVFPDQLLNDLLSSEIPGCKNQDLVKIVEKEFEICLREMTVLRSFFENQA